MVDATPPTRPDGKPNFYGRRKTHKLRPQRQKLVDELLPALRIDAAKDISLSQCFGRVPTDLRLEIGFGAGEHLSGEAAAHPEVQFIGCEPFINGVAALLSDIDAAKLTNIRIFDDDARLLLARLPRGCLSKIYVLFPDPWPKSRHHRRRFVQQDTLGLLAAAAAPDAELIFASDHMGYIAWTLAEVRRHGGWRWTARRPDDWRQPPPGWIATRYERKARRKGDVPAFLVFKKAA